MEDQDDVTEVGLLTARKADVNVWGVAQKSRLEAMMSMAAESPRSVAEFTVKVRELCTLNEDVADQCLYALPRKDKNGQRVNIEGPSIRMAEIILKSWKNAGVMARVLDDSGDYVVAEAVFIDFEDKTMVTKEVRRRITTSSGHRYSADMIGVTANAAISIASRNVILGAIPRALWNGAYEAAKATAAGTMETLEQRRNDALKWLKGKGVAEERVFNALDVVGVEDIGLDELATLRALVAQVKQGEMKAEDAFPVPTKEETGKKGMAGMKEKLGVKAAKDTTTDAKEATEATPSGAK